MKCYFAQVNIRENVLVFIVMMFLLWFSFWGLPHAEK